MADHSNLRLGKRLRRHDTRTLKLARYLKSSLPPAPPSVDYTGGIADWGMMLNDRLGCCTIAAVAHAIQTWTANAGAEITFPDPVILDYYRTWDGYNPADPATDQGGVELNVLNDWRQQSFSGHSLDAYVSIDLRDASEVANRVIGRSGDRVNSREIGSSAHLSIGSSEEQWSNEQLDPSTDHPITGSPEHPILDSGFPIPDVATAIWLFGGAYIGVELPISAQTQDVWDVPANLTPDDEPGSWGGHAVYLVGYEAPVTTPALSAPPLLNQEGSFAGPNPVSRVPAL